MTFLPSFLRRRPNSQVTLAFLLIVLMSSNAYAITTVPVDVKCPICGTVNKFYDYASWGSYIYQWPSKFQLVFFPHTYGSSLYHCKHCHYSLWMWDFKEEVSEDRKKLILETLKQVTTKKEYKSYTEMPMSERLAIAESVYKITKKPDDLEFWSQFYRIVGYHSGAEGNTEQARSARTKALQLTLAQMNDKANEGKKKELLYVAACMQHYLGDDTNAAKSLESAAKLTIPSTEKNSENMNSYLNEVIAQYVKGIKEGQIPKDGKVEE